MHPTKADIVDIFSSIQGEGIFLGARQIFVRFKRCNLRCRYCDEPRDLDPKLYSATELMNEIQALERSRGIHHSVSLTGGEPLCYTDFLKIFLPVLVKNNFKSYLETNGTLPEELERIIDLVDIIAMDFKLPSSTGEGEFWNEHRRFLKTALKKKVFVKAVVTPDTTARDIEKAVLLITEAGKDIPLILQPATPSGSSDKKLDKDRLLGFLEIGMKNGFENIRIISQMHKIIGVK